jgi:DNA-binding NarL/FixJ family response regulator
VSLFVAGTALHERNGSTFEDDADEVAADAATAEAALGADEVATHRTTAMSWTRADAVSAATELVPTLPGPAPAPADEVVLEACKRVGLTAREFEIVGHLVRRHTDQEIAQRLFISTRTVTTHVSAVLRKLGVSSRREVADAAERLGLTRSVTST